jgi:DNA modification methylase
VRTGRIARVLELDPLYVDVAIRRWQSFTGEAATMAITGKTFAEVEERRGDPLQ